MDIFGTIKSTFDKRIDKDLVDVYTIFNRFSNDLLGTTVYASNSIKDFQGNNYYSLQELFEDYEWYDSDSNTWEMFGVEE